ncbi:MAG: PhoPQ-activated pathogenicity-related family protein [Planctomycetales bacterium]|nr:PhoPQ-activated pathogenicity-related family protein [Planctomycetales bacterium]
MTGRKGIAIVVGGLLCGSLLYATALDNYVALPDASFDWFQEGASVYDGTFYANSTACNLKLTSQTWRNGSEVTPTVWTHWVTVIVPSVWFNPVKDTALILINEGDIGEAAPILNPAVNPTNRQFRDLAMGTGSVIIELRSVPNQPLVFADEGLGRVEDEIIAYTWDKFLAGGDDYWPVQLPMVKSVVACMDAVQEFRSSINHFVLTGGSKRGWTAWLTAAVDNRVTAIAPIVSDLLNMRRSFAHHWSCYGFWAEALNPYEEMGIFDWFEHPRTEDLMAIVDPYEYRSRLTIPKFIVTAAGDDFFVHDSVQFYIDDLVGEKFIRTMPNTNHYLDGAYEQVFQNMVPYYDAFLRGVARPSFTWTYQTDGSIVVNTATTPLAVNLWQADNSTERDFRRVVIGDAWTPTPLTETSPGSKLYIAGPGVPMTGWRSFFVELVYDFSGSFGGQLDTFDYHFTTEMRVLPEVRPFEADFDRNRTTDAADLLILAEYWLADVPYYDIIPRRTGDGILNLADFTAFGLHWLAAP